MDTIKLQYFWISDTNSDPKNNKVYKAKGFKILLQKDSCDQVSDTLMILKPKPDGVFVAIDSNSDLKGFSTEKEANQYRIDREKNWLKQVKEYQGKVNNYENRT
jgi:hypothetical protein